jgi:uncharacterized protein YecE (DUF72 family)
MKEETANLNQFLFRGIHPKVFLGTATDRYAGWIGQIYPQEAYAHRLTRRKKTVGGKSYMEEVLPIESVGDYFKHFRVLELDFTFYRPLLDGRGKPSPSYKVLQAYKQYLRDDHAILLKAPQAVFARKSLRAGKFSENVEYLNPELFTRHFYEPAVDILGPTLKGILFEQEYQRKKERPHPKAHAEELDRFFQSIPEDRRYHIELRTFSLLGEDTLHVLQKHGIGQVFSYWIWLPPLLEQFQRAGGSFFNGNWDCVIRLVNPRGMRYQEAYDRAHPFNALVEGLLSEEMVADTAALMWAAVEQGLRVHVVVNNRPGGNAPLIAKEVAARFLATAKGPF